MEPSGMAGGMLSGMPTGMLGLEMPLHQQQHHHHQHPHQHQHQHHQMVAFAAHEADHHTQSQQSAKQHGGYPYNTKGKQQQQQLALSDEDELGFTADEGGGEAGKRGSPWQRMKWTDNMVRLLIMVVFYVGDEAGPEGSDPSCTGKKKSGGLLQKKGKWKSVSRAMMEKGYNVSPQQCEDKFNDLNKRYKRVNDILGKGTACRVVENQSLLETMDQLSPKMKEEVRKLLNSKHLFFREMCAYHNYGGGGGGGGGGAHQTAEVAMESSHHNLQQHCFHSPESANVVSNSRNRIETEGSKMVKGGIHDEEDEDGDDEDEDEDEDEEDEEEIEDGGGGRSLNDHGDDEDDDCEKLSMKKRQRRGIVSSSSMVSPSIQQLNCELMAVLQDGTKNPWEQRQWMRSRSLQLEEQRVSYQCQAFELEKQRLKWVKFSGKKEREMERMKLDNERMRLKNERMVLLLHQKELELHDLHQQQHSSNKRPEPSSITG
ncbi:hypothetical protein HHK36_031712 [Tetracentron sinense]|uniref:Myb/SANT-like DNA-binding domain-containing protein n=1 Tax=Tetracentron sinense TaxID=13715 RepID=A0A834YBC2_TETSI|nr:hypothetical protein HHK36_031712 [Tetracentron sinense]